MATCELTLDLDHDVDLPLKPGERLSGHVVVDVDQDVNCRGLTVDFLWRTHGSGNKASGTAQRELLFEGAWKAGSVLRYPFEFEVPDGPATYHGHHLNVDWFVHANADIPWGFDPDAGEDVLIDCRGAATYDHGPKFVPGVLPGQLAAITQTVIGVAILGFSSIFVLVALGILMDGAGLFAIPFMLAPMVVGGIGVSMIFRAWRSKIAERLLGSVDIEVPSALVAGEKFDVMVHCEPIRDLKLTALTMVLRCQEVVVRGSGTNKRTSTHTVYEEVLTEPGGSLTAGEMAVFARSIQIPGDAAPSFAAPDNALRWELEIRFDIPKWPDWLQTHQLAVRP